MIFANNNLIIQLLCISANDCDSSRSTIEIELSTENYSRKMKLNVFLYFIHFYQLVCFHLNENSTEISKTVLENKFKNTENCGIMSQTASGLIHNGKISSRAHFPWTAILSVREQAWNKFLHRGSGSLISSKFVLAGAQSVSFVIDPSSNSSQKLFPVAPDRVKVFVGVTKFNDLTDPGALKLNVSQIFTHPNATKVTEVLAVNKISIIVLESEVQFNEFIRPICLVHSFPVDNLTNRNVYAVGYGYNENGIDSLTKKHVHVNIIDQDECKIHYKDQLEYEKVQQFCVLGNGNEGPCINDIQLYVKIDSIWYLKGIFNSAWSFKNFTCNVKKPVLYEDVTQHIPWIETQIANITIHADENY